MTVGPLRVSLRESLRSTAVRPGRFGLGALICGLIMAAPAVSEVTALDRVTDILMEEEARGSQVLIVESDGATLDGRACAAIGGQQGVLAAGGVTAPAVVPVGDPPLTTVRSVAATPGYLTIIWDRIPRSLEPTAVLGSDLAQELSFADGAPLTVGGDRPFAAWAAPPSPREGSSGRWITFPAADLQRVQQCWIEAAPGSLSPVRAMLPAMFSDAQSLTVSSLRDDSLSEVAVNDWEQRPSRWLYLLCGAVAGVIVGSLLSTRTAEYALYRLLGLSRATVFLIAAAEALLLLHAAVLLAGLTAAAVLPALAPAAPGDILSSLLLQVATTGAVAAVVTGLACALLTAGNPAQTIRSHR